MTMRRLRRPAIVAASILAFGVTAATADAAITVTRSELNSSQLRVEGSGALPNATVVVNPGAVSGTSDSTGAYRIESTPYSSSTCRVTVGDGAYSGAGTVLRRNVPPGALAVTTGAQRNLEGWVARKRPGTPAAEAAQRALERDQTESSTTSTGEREG